MTQTLGKYEVITELGRGGFGVVFKAHDTALNRTVALKVLAPHLLADPGFAAQIRREAQLAARLEHPNIVTIFEVGEYENVHFIAMQYVEGGSLERWLTRGEAWPLARVLPLAEQVAAALDYAHSQGVLHLDLKPGNILLSGDPGTGAASAAWLADFGLGRAMGGASVPGSVRGAGTPAYMAPEQADLESVRPITAQTDLYAFGILLYQLCTGRLPFEGNPIAVAAAHVNQQPPRPTLLHADLPQAVEDVLLRALAKTPQARFPAAADLAAALAEAARAAQVRPAVRRVLAAPPLALGDYHVRTLRELAQACDGAWEQAVERLYDGSLEAWLAQARILAAAEEAQRIREVWGKSQGREREKGLEEFLHWTGYVTDPVLSVSPEVVDFGIEEKGFGYRLQALVTIQNAGRGLLWGKAQAAVPWLTVAEGAEFTVRPGERHEAVIEAEVDALPSGLTDAAAAVAVETQAGREQAGARVEVLGPAPQIAPAEMDFGEMNAGDEPVRSVTIANRGHGALDGTARSDVPWLAVTPVRFRCTAGRQQMLEIKVVSMKRPLLQRIAEGTVTLITNEGTAQVQARLINTDAVPLELVRIPTGEFLYGENKQKIVLPEFQIAKTPVTNAQYKVFVDATGYRPPGHWQSGQIPQGKANHPVANVSWDDAQKFCEWAGVRLPTEQEWEKAARGTDGREYPWGGWQRGRCNSAEAAIGDTTPVDRFPNGASPYEVWDMAGNVWEWCGDFYDNSELARVLRGGSFGYDARNVRCASRNWGLPPGRDVYSGFRVVSPGLSALVRG
jgi:formylglycine-generating enzyme required for sulfatase activity